MISDDDAAELARLKEQYRTALEDAEEATTPAKLAYYRKLVEVADRGGTQEEIAARLGLHRSRVGQLLDKARRESR